MSSRTIEKSQPGLALGVLSEAVGENLDGHVSTQVRVLGAVDFAHATNAKRSRDYNP